MSRRAFSSHAESSQIRGKTLKPLQAPNCPFSHSLADARRVSTSLRSVPARFANFDMATTHFLDQLHRHYGRRRGHSGSSSGSESGRQSASGSSRPDPAVSRVRRALFGGGNREENIRFAQEQLARSRREASDRWDFDFENDRPILGRNYEWELAQPGGNRARNTPYDRPNVCDKPAAAIAAAAAEATAVCEAVNAVTTGAPTVTVAEVTTEVTAPAESGAPKSSSSQRQRQPSITGTSPTCLLVS